MPTETGIEADRPEEPSPASVTNLAGARRGSQRRLTAVTYPWPFPPHGYHRTYYALCWRDLVADIQAGVHPDERAAERKTARRRAHELHWPKETAA
jgi:hypothetical protein